MQSKTDNCSFLLENLIFQGLLERREVNRSVCYKANRSTPAWGTLDLLFGQAAYMFYASPVPLAQAVFLDRDGVINKVLIKGGRPVSPINLHEFELEEGVKEAFERLKKDKFLLIVVTNQPDIARGKMSRETLEDMTEMIYSTIPVNAIWICEHDDADGCNCRKPKPGMLLEAAKRWGIDCSRSFMVGDSWKDMGAGHAAGCTTILLDRPYNNGVTCGYRLPSLKQAVELILRLSTENALGNQERKVICPT